MRTASTIATACVAALALTGCVRFQLTGASFGEPIAEGSLDRIDAGGDDLEESLRVLGAPLFVWEAADAGIALAWGWSDQTDWSISVSYSLEQFVSVSYSFDSAVARLFGIVVVLNEDGSMRFASRGMLRDLVPAAGRRRPAPVIE